MTVVIIRHGEADSTPCDERGFIAQGLDFAPLTQKGVSQAENAATDANIDGAELIVSSPYTRALQTAAIISRIRNLPLTVDLDLREWTPDLTYRIKKKDIGKADGDFCAHLGVYPPEGGKTWESVALMEERMKAALTRFLNKGYKKIVCVSHGMLMNTMKPYGILPNCFVDTFEFDESFKCADYVIIP